MVYGVWRVESFTRVGCLLGSPLGSRWVTCWVTCWVTRWVLVGVRFATAFASVFAGCIDPLLRLFDLTIGPAVVPQAVFTDGEVLLRHRLDRLLLGLALGADDAAEGGEFSRKRRLAGVVVRHQQQVGAVLGQREARGVAPVVARVELEVVNGCVLRCGGAA